MTTLRCTAKLRKRLGVGDAGEPPPPSNRLGDWFANIIYTHRGHFVMLVSERSLLPVLTTARDLDNLVPRFLDDLAVLLDALGVSSGLIKRELELMLPVGFGRTNSRVVLGSMNDFFQMFKFMLPRHPETTPLDWSRLLARTPCGPIGMQRPMVVASRLLRDPHDSDVIDGGMS